MYNTFRRQTNCSAPLRIFVYADNIIHCESFRESFLAGAESLEMILMSTLCCESRLSSGFFSAGGCAALACVENENLDLCCLRSWLFWISSLALRSYSSFAFCSCCFRACSRSKYCCTSIFISPSVLLFPSVYTFFSLTSVCTSFCSVC